jgi:DnaJ-class molecular chaperone
MVLHPDKNPGNQDEATIRFQQLQQAYNLLNPQGGGRRKRHTRSRRHKSHKTHRHRHRHRHGKTNRRHHRK